MKNFKKIIPLAMVATLTVNALPVIAHADSSKVVTLGADLTEDQRTSMYTYFGTTADEVTTIEVNNTQERQYLEGIAPEAQIGTKTYSCAYVEPTTSGGIQVKTANLTYVTSSMIASTLTTSGVENCNVVASAPFAVSGTGALTGIMLAYEKATGTTLDEGQKEAATEELVTTTELADSVGQDTASDIINNVKEEVISDDLTDESDIQDAVSDAASDAGVTLTDDQISQITSLMEQISQYDYDVNALEDTLNNLSGKDKGFLENIVTSIKDFFTGESEGGILNDTDDDSLGAGTVIDSTLDSASSDSNNDSESDDGFFSKISKFLKNIFGGSKSDSTSEDSSVKNSTTTDSYSNSNSDDDTDADNAEDTTNSSSYSTTYDSNTESSSGDSSTETTEGYSSEDSDGSTNSSEGNSSSYEGTGETTSENSSSNE